MRLFFEHSVGAQELDDRLNAVAEGHADRRAERSAAEIFCFNAAFAESLFTYGKSLFRRFFGFKGFREHSSDIHNTAPFRIFSIQILSNSAEI